jgi:hypothetical protein
VHGLAAAGGGFLLAVLWFDLMFDVQVCRPAGNGGPDDVLASISAYYRRVTTEARPMNRLVAMVMLLTLGAIIDEVATSARPVWSGWASLAIGVVPMGLAAVRTVPHAVRLGAETDSSAVRLDLARGILRDHLFCFTAIGALVVLQLAVS